MSYFNLIKLAEITVLVMKMHEGMIRSNGAQFYTHPLDVAQTMINLDLPEYVIIAAYLHHFHERKHVINMTDEYLEETYGKKVRDILEHFKEPEGLSKVESKKYQVKKAKKLGKLAKARPYTTEYYAAIITLADKMSNLSTFLEGENSWSQEKREGYEKWCYVIFQHLKGICPPLDNNLIDYFSKVGISGKVDLTDYYNLI